MSDDESMALAKRGVVDTEVSEKRVVRSNADLPVVRVQRDIEPFQRADMPSLTEQIAGGFMSFESRWLQWIGAGAGVALTAVGLTMGGILITAAAAGFPLAITMIVVLTIGAKKREQRLMGQFDKHTLKQVEAHCALLADHYTGEIEAVQQASNVDRIETQAQIDTLKVVASRASPYETLAAAVDGGALTISLHPFIKKIDGKFYVEFQIDNLSSFEVTMQMDKGGFTLQTKGVGNAWVHMAGGGFSVWSCGVPALRARLKYRCVIPSEAFGRGRVARLVVEASFSTWTEPSSKVPLQPPAFECFPDPSV